MAKEHASGQFKHSWFASAGYFDPITAALWPRIG
jgi:hypothetical protein